MPAAPAKTRSPEANAYYWGVVIEHARPALSRKLGHPHTEKEAHAFLKRWCLKGGTTTTLTPTQFFDYVERCRELLARHFGTVVPDPYTSPDPTTPENGEPWPATTA